MSDISIALNRFGLGARPDAAVPGDARAWLRDQLVRFDARPAALADVPTRARVAGDLAEYLEQRRLERQPGSTPAAPMPDKAPPQPGDPGASMMAVADAMGPPSAAALKRAGRQAARGQGRDAYIAAVGARASAALVTPAPFVERLVHFWANHFAVSADKLTVVGLAGLLEFEAIRPHLLGTFGEMLGAVERHPAMLLYLDQAQSVGPGSVAGARATARGNRTLGLNENLAREILELHTLGARTGYTQADVTEFARAMTGWSVAGLGRRQFARASDGAPGDFAFAPALHEPGARNILGKSYPAGGEAQAQAVLDDLAVHPATATHIATKLARHVAGDVPPPALVERLSAAFLRSGGDLPTLYRVLIDAPELWTPAPAKFRTPWEWSIAAYRAMGATSVPPAAITGLLNQLGQPTWRPGSPAGFDDIAASWAGPDAVMRRVEAAERFAARAGETIDARALAPKLFPGGVSAATAQALSRAESPSQALALLLVAPEFMRR